jgi:hypothetical protein
MLVFKFGKTKELTSKDADGKPGGYDMGSSIYSTPIVANGVLYISTRNLLFAIAAPSD